MTAAQTLRKAAALMRSRAEATTPGPWRFTDSEAANDVWDGGMVVVGKDGDPIANLLDEWYENDPGEPAPVNDAEHIASWHPAVALAVADLIDLAASWLEKHPDSRPPWVVAAEVTARAYLGRSS